MIRNIIFDLGNVLLSWKPEEYFIRKGVEKNRRDIILSDVFRSPEWLKLDNGDLSLEEAATAISQRSTLNYNEILSVFASRLEILSPLHQNINILPELKKRGFRLYFLSNFPDDIFEEVLEQHPFFTIFDGGIISARVRLSKPDKAIYMKMFDLYSLVPNETLFIDDLLPNVVAGKETGMETIHLENPSLLTDLLKEKLEL